MRTLKTMKRFAKVAAGRSLHLINDHRVLYRHAKGNYGEGRAIWVNGRRFIGKQEEYFSTHTFAARQLDAIVTVLKSHNIEYFITPDTSVCGHSVGVYEKDRRRVLRSLEALAKTHQYVTLPSYRKSSQAKRSVHISKAFSKKSLKNAPALRISSFVVAPNDSLHGGFDLACNVVFWRRGTKKTKIENLPPNIKVSVLQGASLDGALIATLNNRMGDIIPADDQNMTDTAVGNKKYKTFKVFDKKFLGDIQFPIDIVYTWVNGDDPEWIEKYNKYSHVAKNNSLNNTSSRYINRNELKYSLRSVAMYGGFVRNIYIVTDGQTPTWLDTSVPGVKIVSHEDIFSDKAALPVFNSHAIESQLHHIKGLSEYYLYLNDDMFLGRHISANEFFHANGVAKLSPSSAQYGVGKPSVHESAPSSAGKNVRALLEKEYGQTITQKYKHTPYPQIKSVAYENEQRYQKAHDTTMRARFRSVTDVPFAGTMMASTLLLTGKGVPVRRYAGVVDIASPHLDQDLNTLIRKQPYTFCLNDSNTQKEELEAINKRVIEFMEHTLPFKSPWEV